MTHQKVIISRSHEARVSRLQTVTLAHGVSVSGFLLSRCNFPSPRKIFLYPGPCLRVAHRRGGEGAPLAGSCKWPNSPNFPSLGPALGQDTPGRALPGCLECWPRQRGLAKVSGKWVTVHWRTVHCTGHSCTVHESLHICICNLLNQIVEKIFTATALIVS